MPGIMFGSGETVLSVVSAMLAATVNTSCTSVLVACGEFPTFLREKWTPDPRSSAWGLQEMRTALGGDFRINFRISLLPGMTVDSRSCVGMGLSSRVSREGGLGPCAAGFHSGYMCCVSLGVLLDVTHTPSPLALFGESAQQMLRLLWFLGELSS